jgi:hypothetical protein
MSKAPQIFVFLSTAQFNALTQAEKIAYIARAVAQLNVMAKRAGRTDLLDMLGKD